MQFATSAHTKKFSCFPKWLLEIKLHLTRRVRTTYSDTAQITSASFLQKVTIEKPHFPTTDPERRRRHRRHLPDWQPRPLVAPQLGPLPLLRPLQLRLRASAHARRGRPARRRPRHGLPGQLRQPDRQVSHDAQVHAPDQGRDRRRLRAKGGKLACFTSNGKTLLLRAILPLC
jgi:hypothetical protein